ncbi:MAG: hypothetical protein RI996_314 [Candidatus Parcubacteria bacterium]|jgi:hypothetical protein
MNNQPTHQATNTDKIEQPLHVIDEPKESSKETDVFLFIQNKTEKLSAALYMVTSYIADTEPVKSLLRVTAFSSAGHASHLALKQQSNQFHELEKDIVHILSLTKLSHSLGIMSHMNGEILTTEYNKLLALLRTQKGHRHSPMLTTDTEHDTHHYVHSPLTKGQLKGHTSDQTQTTPKAESTSKASNNPIQVAHPSTKSIPSNTTLSSIQSTVTPVAKQTVHTTPKKVIPRASTKESRERRSGRQIQVLSVLSTDRGLSIKEITARIKGCSEKTIQRELNELASRNQVKRTGEKRWSKYIKLN